MPSSSLVTLIVLEDNSLKVSGHPDDEIIHGSPMNMEVPECVENGVSHGVAQHFSIPIVQGL